MGEETRKFDVESRLSSLEAYRDSDRTDLDQAVERMTGHATTLFGETKKLGESCVAMKTKMNIMWGALTFVAGLAATGWWNQVFRG